MKRETQLILAFAAWIAFSLLAIVVSAIGIWRSL